LIARLFTAAPLDSCASSIATDVPGAISHETAGF
jgi:hypothetical protein